MEGIIYAEACKSVWSKKVVQQQEQEKKRVGEERSSDQYRVKESSLIVDKVSFIAFIVEVIN